MPTPNDLRTGLLARLRPIRVLAVAALLLPALLPALNAQAEGPKKGAGIPRSVSPADAQLYLISPADGATVSSPVTVRFGLGGMGVAPAGVVKGVVKATCGITAGAMDAISLAAEGTRSSIASGIDAVRQLGAELGDAARAREDAARAREDATRVRDAAGGAPDADAGLRSSESSIGSHF